MFVDADDTLWENNRWFRLVLDDWSALVAAHGVEPAAAEAALHATEERNIPVTGYGAAPFVRSAVETFHALLPMADLAARRAMAEFARRAERTIRDHPIELLPGVAEGVARIAAARRVVVLTKGDDAEQRGKAARSGLAAHFHAVHVVPEKNAACYAEAAERFGAATALSYMVGNSPASDIAPALAAGLRAVHVPHPAPWHRDAGPVDPRARSVASFADVPGVVLAGPRGPCELDSGHF